MELQQVTQNPSMPPLLSNIGLIAVLHMWYPMDDIMVDTPYCLHVPLNRVENKTEEVPIGMVMPWCVFHNNSIPVEYAKVLVREITDMSYIDYPLDHITLEGVKKLGEDVNQFILWNRHEIVLEGPVSPQNQLTSPLSQMATPKDKEAPLPMSLPSVPKFKEASLPSSPKEKEASPLPTSPVKVMPQLPSPMSNPPSEQDLPPSSPYNTIH
jgi:hypothetical protein